MPENFEAQNKRQKLISTELQRLHVKLEISASKEIQTLRVGLYSSSGLTQSELGELESDLSQYNSTTAIYDTFIRKLAEKNVLDDATILDIFYAFFYENIFRDNVTRLIFLENICASLLRWQAQQSASEDDN